MVTLTTEEWDALGDPERGGSPAKQKAHIDAEERIVFGTDFQKRRDKTPIEQGIGAQGRETNNHFSGIRKYEGEDAYWEAVAEIWKRDPERAKKLNLPKPKEKAKV